MNSLNSFSDSEAEKALEIAVAASHIAAAIINCALDKKSSEGVQFEMKSSSADLVTKYDKACELEVISFLKKKTPSYGIVSEETNSQSPLTARPTWVVDPIDGTMSFVHGMHDCSFSIGLVVNREPVVGVINIPRIKQIYTSVKGKGSFCNGRRISVSKATKLENSVILNYFSSFRSSPAVESTTAIHKELLLHPVHSIRCHGSAAFDMCLVASGKAEVYFNAGTKIWDIAAGTIIIREAGGIVHDLDSTNNFDISTLGVCCGNSAALTSPIVRLVRKHNYKNILQRRGKL